MNIEFVGKFYDNHSLTIINRNIIFKLTDKFNVFITPLDQYDPKYGVDKEVVKKLKELEAKNMDGNSYPEIQIRHAYPPIWQWPAHEQTKVVYIQPWEYPKVPFEWQYKWETFADHLIVPSNYIKQVVVQGGLNPSTVSVIPNGYNPEIFNKTNEIVAPYGIDPAKFNFVYVGNSQWRKGLDLLINAWHKCFKSYDNARLIIKDNPAIYGQNNILNEIIKMQYKTECAPVIYIDDNLPEHTMADIFRCSKVLVHPYRAEGFGMHIQEAMACGCLPLISADGPSDDFVPDDVGIKIPTQKKGINITDQQIFAQKPGDAFTLMSTHTFVNEPSGQHLEKALRYVYHNHDKSEVFKGIDNHVPKNTWDHVVKMYEEVIENVGNNKSRPRRLGN